MVFLGLLPLAEPDGPVGVVGADAVEDGEAAALVGPRVEIDATDDAAAV
jgi:hypothetical protein